MSKKAKYTSPKGRARRLADAVIGESVNSKYTRADNAIFLLEVTGLICAAFREQVVRCDILRRILNTAEAA